MTRILFWFAMLVVMILGGSFALLNSVPVTLNYYFGTMDSSLAMVVVVVFIVGVLGGLLTSIAIALRLKRALARLHREARIANREIRELRTLPLKDV